MRQFAIKFSRLSRRDLHLIYKHYTISQLKEIQSHLTVSGEIGDTLHVGNLSARFAVTDLSYAGALLHHSSNRSVSIWNTAIRALSENHQPHNAFLLCKHMVRSSILPDNYTFSFLFRACAEISDLVLALVCHSLVIKLGWERYDYVQNGLIHCYASCESIEFARRLFDESSNRDVITWTAVINGYIKIGEVGNARKLFDKMPNRNAASWSCMINGYAQKGMPMEALEIFNNMLVSGIRPNFSGLVGALSACSFLGELAQGMWIHAYIDKNSMELDGVLGTALIDMYAKCGCIDIACDVFDKLPTRDVFAYASLILGLANHGESVRALEYFKRMEGEGVRPNEVTFICVLTACSRAGMVGDGLRIFGRMKDVYGITPRAQHYGCLVDLLGRAGLVEEANEVVRKMPVEADEYVLGALLNGCRFRDDVHLGKTTVDGLSERGLDHSGVRVLISNIYASLGKWDEVERVRREMAEERVKRIGGCSLLA